MKGPLQGVRVLAVERHLAGPYGSMVLGDLGAEVLKIEPPGEAHGGTPSHKGESAYYLAFNRNKKSVTLDITTKTGLQAFYDLAELSDVVWNNSRPGVTERLRIDYETLKKVNPRIICCSITGYGPTGPYAKLPSYDVIAQGMVGILLQTGVPGGPPIRPAPSIADISGSLFAAIGVISALWQREITGKGQQVDVNLLDGAMAFLSLHYTSYFLDGEVPPPLGSGHLQAVPFGAYRTKDSWITIGLSWPRIARTLHIEWVLDDPRFATARERMKNRDALNAVVTEALGQMDTETWLEILRADDIACGPVNNLDQAARDPQILHNGMILSLEHVLGGQINLVGNPIKMPAVRTEDYIPPPTPGQHTQYALSELLGYSEEKIAELRVEQERHTAELRRRYTNPR